MRSHSFLLGLAFVIFLSAFQVGCGSNGVVGEQFTIDVEGTVTLGDPTALNASKFDLINGQPQVVIGTSIVEVNQDFADRIGVDFVNFDARGNAGEFGEIQITNNPQQPGTGTLYKRDHAGNPLGTSTFNLPLILNIQNATPPQIDLGNVQFQADPNDPNRIPLLANIPVLSFLFNNQTKRAETTELLIIITPTLVDALDGE